MADRHTPADIAPGAVLITGAASGIGREIAIRCASFGYTLGLLDHDADRLAEVASRLRAGDGTAVIELAGDIGDEPTVADAFGRLADEAGPINAVIAAAGIWAPGTVESTSLSGWERALAVNLTGVFLTARHGIPALRRAGGGAFVAVASDAGLMGAQDCAAYVASKHAVVGLIRALALDHAADGIRSNAICPGFVETPMLDAIFAAERPAARSRRQAQVPLGRFATPPEVADLAAFLLSPAAAYLNGETFRLDGGAGAGPFTPAAA